MRKFNVVAVLAIGALVARGASAADVTEADFQKAMKDVLGGMQAAGKTMREAGDLAVVATAARTIDAALASAHPFWVARKTDDAIEMNTKARAAVMALAKAADSKDAAATGEAMKGVQASCKACHDVHREQLPDRTYKVK